MYIGKNNTSTNKYNKVFSFQSTCIRLQLSLFFWPNYVPTFVVKFKHTFTTCLHDRIISLRGGEVCVHKTSLTPATFYWSVCTKPGQKVSMYLCVSGIDFVSFYDFDIWFRKCSVSVVFLCFYLFTVYWYNWCYNSLLGENDATLTRCITMCNIYHFQVKQIAIYSSFWWIKLNFIFIHLHLFPPLECTYVYCLRKNNQTSSYCEPISGV
jgi:F0F1-type ATP synthase assembly protein I